MRGVVHHFFADQEGIEDKQLLPLVEEALDREHPREWYYALMDYGTHLAKTVPNPNRRSKHHSVQSRFEGSDRQLRGAVLRALAEKSLSGKQLIEYIDCSDQARFDKILKQLTSEGFVELHGNRYRLVQ